MAIKIKTIPYKPAYKQLIIDLLDSKPFKKEIWDWQFMQNPCVEEFDPVVLVDGWGTIIGFNGSMPVRIKYNGEIVKGLWSCDFFIDSRYHGKGFGKAIKQELHTYAPLIMALGISDMAAPVLERMGWKKNNIVDSFKKLNRIPNVKSVLLAGLQLINRTLAVDKKKQSAAYKIVLSEMLPDESLVNQLWDDVSKGYNKIVVRDYPYLHWRYERHPLASYQFISAWRHEQLAAFIVVRITELNAHIVDYIGPAKDYSIKAALLKLFLSITSHLDYVTCSTSDGEWKQIFHDFGFYKQPGILRFYVYSTLEEKADTSADWFIIGGDSDGDMLKASEEGPLRYDYQKHDMSQSRIKLRQLTEEEFLSAEREWDELVDESNADPLFLGWTWQSHWWRQWAGIRGFSLYLLGAYVDNKLVGLAPLYKTTKHLHFLYQFTQLQFIGSSWGSGNTVRTEYLDFIVNNEYQYEIRQSFLDYLSNNESWDQIVFSDLDKQSPTKKLLIEKPRFRKFYTRMVQVDTGISIDVSKSFTEYKLSMGRNTRYSAFNQRKILNSLGNISIDYAKTETAELFLEKMNELHALRWGGPCFPQESMEFHIKLAKALSEAGSLQLSMISLSNNPVSILYDIRVGKREYNIQAGFDSRIHNKLSPGFLHLGYAIESAFKSSKVTVFDLLAGPGMNTFYKSRFGSKKSDFVTLQITRSVYLKMIYKIYDWLPLYIKSIVKTKIFRISKIFKHT